MIKRALVGCAVALLIASGANEAASAHNPRLPVVTNEAGVIKAVAKRSANVGWPHRWNRAELRGAAVESMRRVEMRFGAQWRFNRGECWPVAPNAPVGRGATCFGTIVLTGGDRIVWAFTFRKIFEDGCYRL